jgi:glycosyltransferase involved in cell wall biosynthesis
MHSREANRILLVTDLWHTHPNGVATAIDNLKKELERKGHTVGLLEPGQFFSIPFFLYPDMRLALFARRDVGRAIQEGKYDEIHIATEGPLGWYARSACRRLGLPFTTAFHGQSHLYAEMWLGRPFAYLVKKFLVRFHSQAALTLVTTPAMKEQLHSLGLNRVYVWPLGINEIFFTRGICPVELPKPVFMFFGRVSSEKSVEEFLLADLPGTKLVVGDGPDKEKLEARFPEARFVGSQKGSSLIAWCSCADVLVMPSRTETFGLVMVESLALGIPVAAHDVTGPREIITDGVNGYLDENIARAAKRCLSLSAKDCRDSVQKYTWAASAGTFLSALESAHTPQSEPVTR